MELSIASRLESWVGEHSQTCDRAKQPTHIRSLPLKSSHSRLFAPTRLSNPVELGFPKIPIQQGLKAIYERICFKIGLPL
jgi:hypothetical protein